MTDTTPNARAKAMLDQLNHALGDRDFAAASRLFADECYWRDLVLLTWNIKTMEGRSQIADMLAAQLDAAAPVRFRWTSASRWRRPMAWCPPGS